MADGDRNVNRGRIITSLLLSCHIFPPQRTARRGGGGPTSASCARHFSYYRTEYIKCKCTYVYECVGKSTFVVVIGKRSASVVCKCSAVKCRIDKGEYVIYRKIWQQRKYNIDGDVLFRLKNHKKKKCSIVMDTKLLKQYMQNTAVVGNGKRKTAERGWRKYNDTRH